MTIQKITPHLWFDTNAEEAIRFYVSLFANSKITGMSHYGEGARMPQGMVMAIQFELDGQAFAAINGGPIFKFSEAISFMVNCDDQAEIDRLWHALVEGGKPQPCGWLKDRFGLSWQINFAGFAKLVTEGGDPARAGRVMEALMKMQKIDVAVLKAAYAGS
jgi:predicted 3-demethylubiquinone-9 3-methyltransferase (glyoxalase superfamily)